MNQQALEKEEPQKSAETDDEVFLFFGRCIMKPLYLLFLTLLLWCGCASFQPQELPDKLPHLIEQEPFPPMSYAVSKTHHEFDLKLQIEDNGNVLKAVILNPTGEAEWDSIATLRIGKWKFSPAIHAGNPIRMWVTIRAYVKSEEPLTMGLAEFTCMDLRLADSVHSLLLSGEDFGRLVSLFSISKSKANDGDLGQVDIHRYAHGVQKALRQLKENEITEPLAMGQHYVIFKRLALKIPLQ
jgi:hypothetical protein